MLNSPRLNTVLIKSGKLVCSLSVHVQEKGASSKLASVLYVPSAHESSSSSTKSLNWLIQANREKESADSRPHDRSFFKGHYYHEKVIMGYSREQMCNLVMNVADYKEFVPFCINSRIMSDAESKSKAIGGGANTSSTTPTSNKFNLNLINKNKKISKELTQQQASVKNQTQMNFRAVLEIGYPPIKESYMSYVSIIRPELVKSISRDTNLFEYLINEWKFHPYDITSSPYKNSNSSLDDANGGGGPNTSACIVEFYVAFKFRSILYSQFSSLFMDQIFKQMVKAFTRRAQQMYGPPSVPLSRLNEPKGNT